jgi:hypothetical protein
VSGAHNDAVMVGLLVAGLTAVAAAGGSRSSWGLLVLGGALLGLAVAVKVTALVVLPFAALVAVGGGRRLGDLLTRGGAVVAGAAGALSAVSAGSGLGVGWVRGLAHSGDSIQWTSPSTAVGLTVNYLGRPFGLHLDAVPVTRVVGVVVLAVVLVVLWWRALVRTDRHLDPLVAAGLALAATVALSPVFHPWYATWPLVILAATWPATWPAARGSAARWLLVPCAVAAVLALPDGTSLALVTRFPGAFVMTAVVVVVVVHAVRRARTPVPHR